MDLSAQIVQEGIALAHHHVDVLDRTGRLAQPLQGTGSFVVRVAAPHEQQHTFQPLNRVAARKALRPHRHELRPQQGVVRSQQCHAGPWHQPGIARRTAKVQTLVEQHAAQMGAVGQVVDYEQARHQP